MAVKESISEEYGIKLPLFEEIERYNKKDEYKGLELKFHIAHNLFLRISVQNRKVIFDKDDNIIYFSWCTGNDFPIYSVTYKYCEDGYYSGLRDIIEAAKTFNDAFLCFLLKSTIDEGK